MVKNKRWYPINAKDYLNQIRRISCEIAAKEAELSELEKTLHGAAMQEVRVKTSSTHDPMKLVDVIVDFQSEIRQEIAQAISLKKEIHHKINQLSQAELFGIVCQKAESAHKEHQTAVQVGEKIEVTLW